MNENERKLLTKAYEDIPQTRAEAYEYASSGRDVEAGLFWLLVSAQRRSAHYLAWADIERGISLIREKIPGFKIPSYIYEMKGLQARTYVYDWLMKMLKERD